MHNTGNPLGSTQVLDLYDNSEVVDQFTNSQQDEIPDRFGVKRLTLAGLIKRSMALRNEINDFSGTLTFKPEWTDVPMNVSEGVGGEGGALNLQAEALGNRSEINKVTSREALRRSYAEAGYVLVVGSFEQGGTVATSTDVLLYEAEGKAYSWGGALPKTVATGSTPVSTGGAWVDRTQETLRADLNVVIKKFASVADMIADATLVVGQIVETIGYYGDWVGTANKPKGGNRYEIVASGTGTVDGGSFIALSNGLQAKGLFVDGIVMASQLGITTNGTDYSSVVLAFFNNVKTKRAYTLYFEADEKPYIINTMIMVDYAYDFCFEGVGGKAWIKRPDNYPKNNFSNNRMFTVGKSTVVKDSSSIQPQIYFKNLILDGNRSGQPEFNATYSMQHHHAINVAESTDTRKRAKLTCVDVDFRNTGGDGVGIYTRSEVTLIRPTFHNCFRGGVCVVGSDNILKITDAVSTDDLETNNGAIGGNISGYYEEIENGNVDTSCINQVDIDGWDLYQGRFHCDKHAKTLSPVDITKLKTHSFKNVRVHPNNETSDVTLPPMCVVDNCEFNAPTTYINIEGSVITGTKICQHVTDYRKAALIAAGTTTLNAVMLTQVSNYNNSSPVNRTKARSAIRDTVITLDQTALNSGFSLCAYQHPYQAADGGFYVKLHDRDVMLLDNVNILPYYPDWDASATSIGFFDTGCWLDGANCTIRNSTIIAKTCLYIDNSADRALAYVKLKDNTYYFTQYRSVLGEVYIEESGVIDWCDDVKSLSRLQSYGPGVINYGSRKLIVYSDPTSSVGSISNFSIGKVAPYLSAVKKKYIKLPVLNVIPGTLSIVVIDYQLRDTITDDGIGNINSTLGVTGTIDYNLGVITLTGAGAAQTHSGDLLLTCQWTNNVIGLRGDIAILYNNPSTKWKQTSSPTKNSTTATWISVP